MISYVPGKNHGPGSIFSLMAVVDYRLNMIQ